MGGEPHSPEWLPTRHRKVGVLWVGDEHQWPRPQASVNEGEEVVIEGDEAYHAVVLEVSQLQLKMAAGMAPVHPGDDPVEVAAHVSHCLRHEPPQRCVVSRDGTGGVVAEPERVVVALH